MKAPKQMNVSRHGPDAQRYCVGWEDDDFRYHVWLDLNRKPMASIWGQGTDAMIFKNRKVRRPYGRQGAIRVQLSKHPLVASAISQIAQEQFYAADRAAAEKEASENAAARAEAIRQLHRDAELLGFRLVPIVINGGND